MSPRVAAAIGLAMGALLAAAAFLRPSSAQTLVPSGVYAAPRTQIAVDGPRRLNLYCDGSGRPAVVLDAGAGLSMMTWRRVQAEIAKFTRVCSYDRAGLGFSDRAERPSDVRNMVDDLRRLVRSAGIPVPFVYVGHSLAGLVGLHYASTFPDDVAGAVLVDPSLPHQAEDSAAVEKGMNRWIEGLRKCLSLALNGELANPRTPEAHQCADPGPEFAVDPDAAADEVLRRTFRLYRSLPRILEASVSELENITPRGGQPSVDTAEVDASRLSFGARPLAVLTASGRGANAKPAEVWREGHDRIAALSTRGSDTIVPGAGHFIQLDQPRAVIDAVRRVVDAVRAE